MQVLIEFLETSRENLPFAPLNNADKQCQQQQAGERRDNDVIRRHLQAPQLMPCKDHLLLLAARYPSPTAEIRGKKRARFAGLHKHIPAVRARLRDSP